MSSTQLGVLALPLTRTSEGRWSGKHPAERASSPADANIGGKVEWQATRAWALVAANGVVGCKPLQNSSGTAFCSHRWARPCCRVCWRGWTCPHGPRC